MKIMDSVYGEFEIAEPVILELIQSPSMRRLKGVDQAGYFEPHFPGTSHTRFEHSLGVYHLLNIYGAPLEEQIAGLLHDISHSAFSHCIDYILQEWDQKYHSYQDDIHEEFIKSTEIPDVLSRYGIDIGYILNDANFPLKENDIPDICADRIDYSLRTGIHIKEIDRSDIKSILSHLKAKNEKWIFDDFEAAAEYARFFLKLNDLYYSGLPSAIMFKTVGDYISYSLNKRYISKDDLYSTDKEVLVKIAEFHNKDERLKLLWDRMNNKIACENDPEDFGFKVYCKSRVIDPLCFHKEEIKKVSDIHPEWKNVIIEGLKPKVYFLKFER